MDNRIYNILLLNAVFGAGSQKAVKIYAKLNEMRLLDLPIEKSVLKVGIDDTTRERLLGVKKERINKVISDCKSADIRILPIYDTGYPECLRNIAVPPIVLFVKGELPDFDNLPVFCIVGPRKITDFGRKAAYSLARRLSKAGMIIVSGSAEGGDFSAHSGVLSVSGKSVMVSADGIITQLNSKNHLLCKNLLKNGCIISECPPREVARKYSFPIRNRIMSGLSLGVAIVEAPEKSGTLITASHAADQGKDVFVIPGNPTDNAYKGTNALLRDGAMPLLEASDIFLRYSEEFPEQIDIKKAYSGEDSKKLKKNSQKKLLSALSKEAQLVYNNLNEHQFSADDLYVPELDAGSLISALTELEIEHYIISVPGGTYKISD